MSEDELGKLLARSIEIGIAIRLIAKEYGYDAQSRQCIEEMAELTQAINKFWRKKLECGKLRLEDIDLEGKEYDNIAEEIADVLITLAQITILMGCENGIMHYVGEKTDRQISRIRAEKNQEKTDGEEPKITEHAE